MSICAECQSPKVTLVPGAVTLCACDVPADPEWLAVAELDAITDGIRGDRPSLIRETAGVLALAVRVLVLPEVVRAARYVAGRLRRGE